MPNLFLSASHTELLLYFLTIIIKGDDSFKNKTEKCFRSTAPIPTSCLLSDTLTLTYTGVGVQLQGKSWALGDEGLEVEQGERV